MQLQKRLFAAAITPTELSVLPGNSAAITLTLVNQGTAVDEFSVSIERLPDGWVTLPAAPLRLRPDERTTITIPSNRRWQPMWRWGPPAFCSSSALPAILKNDWPCPVCCMCCPRQTYLRPTWPPLTSIKRVKVFSPCATAVYTSKLSPSPATTKMTACASACGGCGKPRHQAVNRPSVKMGRANGRPPIWAP
ncbi:MAG: hypothetical protein M5U34_04940 [Chloroflexi bacterium]|nr:hypothetical protein [Chloroflexota bacterium]